MVVLDADAFQAMEELIDRPVTREAVRKGLAQAARGEGRPLDEVFDELDAKIATRPETP
jgi:predicted transcriptional regulator